MVRKMNNKTVYALFVNGDFYDAHEDRATVQKWFDGFAASIRNKKTPHRWFNKFIMDGKFVKIQMEIVEFTSEDGKKADKLTLG